MRLKFKLKDQLLKLPTLFLDEIKLNLRKFLNITKLMMYLPYKHFQTLTYMSHMLKLWFLAHYWTNDEQWKFNYCLLKWWSEMSGVGNYVVQSVTINATHRKGSETQFNWRTQCLTCQLYSGFEFKFERRDTIQGNNNLHCF